MLAHFMENEPRGEFVIVVAGCDEAEPTQSQEKQGEGEQEEKQRHFSKYRNKQL